MIEANDRYREHSIQIEQVRDTLYAFVWRPGSRVEWGPPVVTATTLEGASRLMKRVRDRIDEDIAQRGGVRLRK